MKPQREVLGEEFLLQEGDGEFLKQKNKGRFDAWHHKGALGHWEVMRHVLKAEVWENW